MNNTGIIILAAGCSSRFGSVKQLLQFKNKTLLQHVSDEAVESGADPIIIVTGANEDEISNSIKTNQAQIVYNKKWKEGMASAIVEGLRNSVTLNNDIKNIIIAVSDQPFVSALLFKQLYQTLQTSVKQIVACNYAATLGTPVLFTQKYFDALMSLQGENGAKKILEANKDDIAKVDFPQGAIDIDTKKDFEDLLISKKHLIKLVDNT